MGKIIVSNIISLDGFFEGPNRNVMVLPMDGSFDAHNLECMKNADVVLLGENSYKFFGGFWPNMANNPDASPTNREFATIYNRIQKVVVSDKLTKADFPEAWKDTTRTIDNDNVYKELEKLKTETKKDIVMYASRKLWNDLLDHKLVDELHFMIGNVFLKDGTPVFENAIAYDDPKVALHLAGISKADDSNNILAKYEVTYKN